jgi:hypothetical protein
VGPRVTHTLAWLVILAVGLVVAGCGDDGQPRAPRDGQRAAAPTVRNEARIVPTGTTLEIRTHTVLSAARNRPGDAFTASLAGPLVDARGAIIVPADARVRGRVTAVAAPAEVGQPAVLQLAFEAISFAGRSVPLQAQVEEVIGRTEISALPGVTVGTAAGTAIGLDATDGEPILPRGTGLLIRVVAPIQVNRRGGGAA